MDVKMTDSGSSFEDLAKESLNNDQEINAEDVEDVKEEDSKLMDVLGNGQLIKKILKEGTPDSRPERSFICVINLEGKLEDGTVIEKFENYVVQIGDTEVVQGLDMCIPLMNVGESAEITLNSRFAYGSFGLKNSNGEVIVPPDATVIYNLELISVKEESDLEKKSFNSRKEIGNKKRERGNFWFERQEYNLAIQSYRRALEYLDETEGGIKFEQDESEPSNSQLQELLEDRIKVYNNLAQAQMKISAFDAALKSVETVLQCQPQNIKALFRKGKILEAKGNTLGAIPLLQKAATLDPENKTIQNELSKLILKSKKEARNEKDMYQKMLGTVKNMEQKKNRVQTENREANSKFKFASYLIASILVAVSGIAIYRYNSKW